MLATVAEVHTAIAAGASVLEGGAVIAWPTAPWLESGGSFQEPGRSPTGRDTRRDRTLAGCGHRWCSARTSLVLGWLRCRRRSAHDPKSRRGQTTPQRCSHPMACVPTRGPACGWPCGATVPAWGGFTCGPACGRGVLEPQSGAPSKSISPTEAVTVAVETTSPALSSRRPRCSALFMSVTPELRLPREPSGCACCTLAGAGLVVAGAAGSPRGCRARSSSAARFRMPRRRSRTRR
jgi:hypothetical protein